MKHGEFWYAMKDERGRPFGYARLEVAAAAGGAAACAWELHLALAGGARYEEERTVLLDAAGRLLGAGYGAGDDRVDVERRRDRLVGRRRRGGEETRLDVRVEDDAQTGLGFVLAASLPFEAGATAGFAAYNEAQGLTPEGRETLTVMGPETLEREGETVDAWKVVLRRADGRELPLWIDTERRIAEVDWGGGNRMVLSDIPTRDLFRPEPPPVDEEVSDDPARLVVAGTLAGTTPDELFAWWTDATRLVRWWPEEAEVGDGTGGGYHLRWKEPPYVLGGTILAWDPGRRLAFTWTWNHLPEAPTREVEVLFAPTAGGTRMVITHGPYGPGDAERRERDGHLQGWRAYGARLAAAVGEGD